jgi:hypothetical protein
MTQEQLTAQQELDALNAHEAEIKRKKRELLRKVQGAKLAWTKDRDMLKIENVSSVGYGVLLMKPDEFVKLVSSIDSLVEQYQILMAQERH